MIDTLRPYQKSAIDQIRLSFKKGSLAVLLVLATGLGKTRVLAAMCHLHLEKNPDARILVIAHRDELIGQIFDELEAFGLACGVIQSIPCRTVNPNRSIQVASIQTLLARGQYPAGITLLIHDEAHHSLSTLWSQFILEYKRRQTRIIGCTATPTRGDLIGLRGVYDDLVCPITVREAIEQGYLVRPVVHAPPKTLGTGQIAADPLQIYKELGDGRKAVVFAPNIPTATLYAKNFADAGIATGLVTGQMDSGARRAILSAYGRGELRVLVNVAIATEGWNDVGTDCIILARSIGSEALFLQICGRGLRLAPGKTDCLILDLHGTVHKYGPPDQDREYTLEGERDGFAKKDSIAVSFCQFCGATMQGNAQVCADCAEERPGMVPPEIVGVKLVRYANKVKETPEQRLAYFRKLQGVAADKGYSKWWPHAKFKGIYGQPPPKAWD